eukprot:g72960.t1
MSGINAFRFSLHQWTKSLWDRALPQGKTIGRARPVGRLTTSQRHQTVASREWLLQVLIQHTGIGGLLPSSPGPSAIPNWCPAFPSDSYFWRNLSVGRRSLPPGDPFRLCLPRTRSLAQESINLELACEFDCIQEVMKLELAW